MDRLMEEGTVKFIVEGNLGEEMSVRSSRPEWNIEGVREEELDPKLVDMAKELGLDSSGDGGFWVDEDQIVKGFKLLFEKR